MLLLSSFFSWGNWRLEYGTWLGPTARREEMQIRLTLPKVDTHCLIGEDLTPRSDVACNLLGNQVYLLWMTPHSLRCAWGTLPELGLGAQKKNQILNHHTQLLKITSLTQISFWKELILTDCNFELYTYFGDRPIWVQSPTVFKIV